MPELVVKIVGDTTQLERSYRKASAQTTEFSKEIDRAGRGALAASVGFKGLGRTVGFASGAFLGGAGLATAAKAAFDEMEEGQKVVAQTAAALKSTGGAAGVTAAQISRLASRIQQYSGFDDEAVQSAENLLLTFTKVRNEAGAGNDVFRRATEAAADLSRRFDQDLSTSAVQLGKALNDPTKGLTALRRVGVSFTDSQVRMIENLQRTGQTLQAQKIILQEVTREVGGSARAYGKTLPGQLDILKGNLANTAAMFAQTLAPSIQKAVTQANAWLADSRHQKELNDDLTTSINVLTGAWEGLATAIGDVKAAKQNLGNLLPPGLHLSRNDILGAIPFTAPFVSPQMKALVDALTRKGAGNAAGAIRVPPQFAGAAAGLQDLLGQLATAGPAAGGAAGGGAGGTFTGGVPGVTVEQRNQFFDNLIGRLELRAGYLTSLRKQIKAWQEIVSLLQQRIDVTRDATRKANLQDELLGAQAQIRGLTAERQGRIDAAEDAAARKAADAARKRAEDEKKRRAATRAAIQAARKDFAEWSKAQAAINQAQNAFWDNQIKQIVKRQAAAKQRNQFLQLGLTGTGLETRADIVAGLRSRLKDVEKEVAGTGLDTARLDRFFKNVQRMLGRGWKDTTRESLTAIDTLFSQIEAKLGKDADKVAVVVAPKMRDLTRGLRLSPAEMRRLEYNLAGANVTVGAGQRVHAGGPITIDQKIQLDVDGKQMAAVTRKHAVKAQQRQSTQTRGRQTR